ncbi:MAG: sugar phosphate isomerase/epimerase [Eubacterium sp.]|nr:sugar phosphate isomerase/epimerase [Eubacterium sp.]
MIKIGCGTVVFREFELERALEAIREIGYEYIETQAVGPWCPHVDVRKDDPVRFADLVKSYGFKGVTGLWMPDGNMVTNANSVESGILAIRWADAAGIPVVHTGDGHVPDGMDEDVAYENIRRTLDGIIEGTPDGKAVLGFEPHGALSLTGKGLQRIMAMAPADRLGVNYDAANIVRGGYVESAGVTEETTDSGYKGIENDEREDEVLQAIADRVVHFHTKDLDPDYNCVPLGDGIVKNRACYEILERAGYSGAFSLETEGGLDFEASCALAAKSYQWMVENLK